MWHSFHFALAVLQIENFMKSPAWTWPHTLTPTHWHVTRKSYVVFCAMFLRIPSSIGFSFLSLLFFFFFMFPPFLLVLGYFEFNGKFIDDMPLSRLTWTFAFAFEAEPPAHNFAISWPQNSSTPILAAPSCVQSFRIWFALVGIHELAHALHSGWFFQAIGDK